MQSSCLGIHISYLFLTFYTCNKIYNNIIQLFHILWKLLFPGQTPVPTRSGTWILDLSHDPIWTIWSVQVRKFDQHHDRIAIHAKTVLYFDEHPTRDRTMCKSYLIVLRGTISHHDILTHDHDILYALFAWMVIEMHSMPFIYSIYWSIISEHFIPNSADSSNELPYLYTTQTRTRKMHASVVTEWLPAYLLKLPLRGHQRGNWRKPRMIDVSNLINICLEPRSSFAPTWNLLETLFVSCKWSFLT